MYGSLTDSFVSWQCILGAFPSRWCSVLGATPGRWCGVLGAFPSRWCFVLGAIPSRWCCVLRVHLNGSCNLNYIFKMMLLSYRKLIDLLVRNNHGMVFLYYHTPSHTPQPPPSACLINIAPPSQCMRRSIMQK